MNKIAEQARLRASLEESAEFGSPVDLSVAVTEVANEKVEIEQVGGLFVSQIFQLQDGRVACIADIVVTNQTSRTIDVIGVELKTPWDNRPVEWLTPYHVKLQGRPKRESSCLVYQFPDEPGLKWDYREVINHRLVKRKLPGTRRLEGLLLGVGRYMPDNLVHGELLEMSLTIIGADHAEYSEPISFWTERLPARPKIEKARTSIFAKPLEELVKEEEAVRARDVTCIAALPASSPPASNRT